MRHRYRGFSAAIVTGANTNKIRAARRRERYRRRPRPTPGGLLSQAPIDRIEMNRQDALRGRDPSCCVLVSSRPPDAAMPPYPTGKGIRQIGAILHAKRGVSDER